MEESFVYYDFLTGFLAHLNEQLALIDQVLFQYLFQFFDLGTFNVYLFLSLIL